MKPTPGIFLLSLLLAISSINCDSDAPVLEYIKNGEEYFPLVSGRFIEYNVDSIVFDDAPGGNKMDTIQFQLREEIGQYYLLPGGDTVYYVHRFRRSHPNENWKLADVWTARYDRTKVLRNEENLTFHKMTMPLYVGQTWTATSYIPPETTVRIGTENLQPYQYWNYRILKADMAGSVGDFQFENGQLLQARQVDDDLGLSRRYVLETYARGIGLVARIDTILDSRCINLGDFTPCDGKPWTVHADKGYILSQVMIDHN